jgi:16S rRNA (guanine966-N2)-methyltransferase
VREGLFGILTAAGELEGARVLDLYAGTGALGLEALSRGAAQATFVESRREALAALRKNVATLGVEALARVIAAELGSGPSRASVLAAGPFDLVLVDPPWALVDEGVVAPVLASLVAAGALREGARLVLEHSTRSERPSIDGCFHTGDRRYGDATLAFYKTAILGRPRGDT